MENGEEDAMVAAELVCIMTPVLRRHSTDLAFASIQIQKGVSSARSDDTKGLKGAILDWIVPHGQSLHPPIARNVKIDRGFHHERTGALLCPADMDWTDLE